MNLQMSDNIELSTNKNLHLQMTKIENSLAKINTYNHIKRMSDIVISGISLIILSPLFLFIYIMIKVDSGGKVIFSQMRIGKNGELFKLYKFRTMVPNADEKLKEILSINEEARNEYKINKKLKNDPRITKVGSILRKTSLDELPQLINVLKGEMSIIGPRPYLVREQEDMQECYNVIIQSKPGITGLWQVSGRNNTTFNDRLRIDLEYNTKKSLKEDLLILVKTIKVVFKRDGAM